MKYSVTVNFISALLLYKTIYYAFAITYVVPTEPCNSSCPSPKNACFTLNEWIENGTHPFTNGTTIMLLSVIHIINSTLKLIQQVSSIVFAGHPHEQTTVECNYNFGFKFYNVKEVNISNIEFKFCADIYITDDVDISFTFVFIRSYNIKIKNVKISNGSVLAVVGSNEGSVFQIHNSTIVSGFYLSSLLQSCVLPEKVEFVDSSFSKLVMTQAANDYCFEFSMQRTSIQNVTGYNEALWIDSAMKISFMDVTFWNNSAPLKLVTGKLIEFKGHNLVSWNSGFSGVTLSYCAQINVYSNATIEFSNNIVVEDLLNIYTDDSQRVKVYSGVSGDDISIIAFVNNTAKNGGIMILESVNRMKLSNTLLIFKNNTCITSTNNHAGILLLISGATLHLTQSNAMFIRNRSPLSGGITLISSLFSISRSTLKFSNNHGTNGGGIALYERSAIHCLIGRCNSYFDHNIAVRRGGAIFIKDADYINTYTRVLSEHSFFFIGRICAKLFI